MDQEGINIGETNFVLLADMDDTILVGENIEQFDSNMIIQRKIPPDNQNDLLEVGGSEEYISLNVWVPC